MDGIVDVAHCQLWGAVIVDVGLDLWEVGEMVDMSWPPGSAFLSFAAPTQHTPQPGAGL